MKENQRLKKLFKDHFNGEPWIDVQLLASLKGLTAREAGRQMHGLNSVWQIVHHLACWRETILERLEGKTVPTPADNYFVEIKDTSPKAWTNALKELKESQKKLLKYLSAGINGPDEKAGSGTFTKYELLQGLLQHDAYHLGQIILIRKMLKGSATGQ